MQCIAGQGRAGQGRAGQGSAVKQLALHCTAYEKSFKSRKHTSSALGTFRLVEFFLIKLMLYSHILHFVPNCAVFLFKKGQNTDNKGSRCI